MADSVAAAPAAPAAPSTPAPSAPSSPASSAPSSPATAAPVTTKAPEFTKRQYKGKVDKEERVWELSDEEVAVRLQKSEAAEKRFQQASEIQKKWDTLRQIAKEDPDTLFRELVGADPNEWATKKVEEKWKLEVMPEHERKVYELEQKLKAYEAGEAKRKHAIEQEQKTKQEQALEAQLEADFQEAFKLSGLDYNPDNLEVFGKLVLAAHDNSLDYTPAQLAALAKAEIGERETKYEERVRGRVTGLKGPELLSYLGDATVKEVLKAAVQKHNLGASGTPSAPTLAPVLPANAGTKTQDRDAKGKYLTTADWRKSFGRG